MKKLHFYFIGIILILFYTNINNIQLLLSGKLAKGKVIGFQTSGLKRQYHHSIIQYNYNGKTNNFLSQSNVVYDIDSTVNVIFLPKRNLSKVYSFKGMFINATFLVLFFGIIWIALVYTYKNDSYSK
jgi:hypothetical protein